MKTEKEIKELMTKMMFLMYYVDFLQETINILKDPKQKFPETFQETTSYTETSKRWFIVPDEIKEKENLKIKLLKKVKINREGLKNQYFKNKLSFDTMFKEIEKLYKV